MSSASMPESESYSAAAAAAASSSESTAGFLTIFAAFACGFGKSRALNSSRTRSLAWKIFARAFAISAVGRSFSRLRFGVERKGVFRFRQRVERRRGGEKKKEKRKRKSNASSDDAPLLGTDRVERRCVVNARSRDTAYLAPFHPSMSYASIIESCWRITLI